MVLDVDRAELALNPTRTRVWAPKGVPYDLETPGNNRKQVLFGMVNSLTGQTHVAFTDHKRSADFQAFVDRCILPAYTNAEFIFLIVDGASIYTSKSTQAWLKERPQVKLVPLPSYAPKLNLQEHIWRWMHKDVTHNHFFRTLGEAHAAAERFFARIAGDRQSVLRYIGRDFPSLIENRLQTIYGSH